MLRIETKIPQNKTKIITSPPPEPKSLILGYQFSIMTHFHNAVENDTKTLTVKQYIPKWKNLHMVCVCSIIRFIFSLIDLYIGKKLQTHSRI